MVVPQGESVPLSLVESLMGQESPVNVLGRIFPGRITGVEILAEGVEIRCEFEIPDNDPLQEKFFPIRREDFSMGFNNGVNQESTGVESNP
jgi:hypothetical protein